MAIAGYVDATREFNRIVLDGEVENARQLLKKFHAEAQRRKEQSRSFYIALSELLRERF